MTIDTDQKLDRLREVAIEDAALTVSDELYRAARRARALARSRTATPRERATWTAVAHIYKQLQKQLDETGFLPVPEEVNW
jgi:hypothetical protein